MVTLRDLGQERKKEKLIKVLKQLYPKPVPRSVIQREVGYGYNTMIRALKQLERQGYIETFPPPKPMQGGVTLLVRWRNKGGFPPLSNPHERRDNNGKN